MTRLRHVGIAVLVAAAIGPGVRVEAQVWNQVGPDGGWIVSLVADPVSSAVVYAATSGGGVYKSVNAGATWSAASQGLTDLYVSALAIDPVHPDTLYAATASSGVFKSGNAGGSWTRAASGLESGSRYVSLTALAIDPSNPSRLCVAGSGGASVFCSTDGAGSWQPAADGMDNAGRVNQLVVDPGSSSSLWAAAQGGLWHSTDGAASWSPVDADHFQFSDVVGVVLVPNAPQTVYAATSDTIWKSTDGGASFAALPSLPPIPSAGARIQTTGNVVPFVRFFMRSTVLEFLRSASHVAATGQPAVVVASDGGVMVTMDDGAHWSYLNQGLSTHEATVVAEGSASDPHIFLGTRGSGVFTLTQGPQWQAASRGIHASTLEAFAFSAAQTVLAGTDGAGVMRSTNGGSSWAPANDGGVEDATVYDFAVDPGDRSRVFAATSLGVFSSTDAGASWTMLVTGLPYEFAYAVAVDPQDSMTVYAGGNDGVRRSSDGGVSWEPANGGIEGSLVRSLLVDPDHPGTLWAGLIGDGVWRSTDNGTTWSLRSGGAGFLEVGVSYALAADASRPGTFYAGTDARAVFKTTDDGATWQQMSQGLLDMDSFQYSTVYGIAVDPDDPNHVWLAAGRSQYSSLSGPMGVFSTSNGGGTWSTEPGPLAGLPALAVTIDPDHPTNVWAGTAGSGGYLLGEAPGGSAQPRRPAGRVGPR